MSYNMENMENMNNMNNDVSDVTSLFSNINISGQMQPLPQFINFDIMSEIGQSTGYFGTYYDFKK
jgi:hypothetical protein